MSAELSARRTAAAAVAADFHREVTAFIDDFDLTRPTPDYCSWAYRLHTELKLLLDGLAGEKPDPAATQLAEIRAVFDVFDWATDDRQYALEQIEQIVSGGER